MVGNPTNPEGTSRKPVDEVSLLALENDKISECKGVELQARDVVFCRPHLAMQPILANGFLVLDGVVSAA